jgi:hypothetical protein
MLLEAPAGATLPVDVGVVSAIRSSGAWGFAILQREVRILNSCTRCLKGQGPQRGSAWLLRGQLG